MRLTVLSPERRLLEGVDVEEVTLTGSEGQIQILPGHAHLVGTLETGMFSYVSKGRSPVYGAISTGFFEVKDDEISVLAETLELQSEIDIDRAKLAQRTAEDTLQKADLNEHQFKKYQLKLQRSLIRQQVVVHRSI